MNDPFEDELRRNYRALDGAAERLEDRLRPKTRRIPVVAPPSVVRWIVPAVAAAAVLFGVLFATLDRQTPRPEPRSVRRDPPPPRIHAPAPVVPETPRPAPPTPPPSESPTPPPSNEPIVPPPVKQEPPPTPPPTPPSTEPVVPPQPAEIARITIDEINGTWSLNGKSQKPAKKVVLSKGDVLTTESVTKVLLAENRFLLLAPKSSIAVEPEEKRLTVKLEKGELLAELIGPGIALRVTTSACAFDSKGTVFDVRIEGGRAHLVVEEGTVDAGGVIVKAGQALVATAGKPVPRAVESDLRQLVWARAHRPMERVLFEETFDEPGDWQADVAKGIATGTGSRSSIQLLRKDTALFRIPVKGRIVIVLRGERAAELAVQIHQVDPKMNFRIDQRIGSGSGWQTIVIELDKIPPNTEPKTTGKVEPGAAVDNLLLLYGRDGEKLGFWVDSIRVVETRP